MEKYLKAKTKYDRVAEVFILAESVHIEINDKKYSGEIIDKIIGTYIVFRVDNIDSNLIQIMPGNEEVFFKVFPKNGPPKTFSTNLIQKKLPRLKLGFPQKEVEKIVRKYPRAHVNLSTAIILVKRDKSLLPPETTGLGAITNISQGGCAINTTLELKKGDKIDFFLEVSSNVEKLMLDVEASTEEEKQLLELEASSINGKKILKLTAIVCNKRELDVGEISIGVEFHNLGRKTKNEIKAYMRRRGF